MNDANPDTGTPLSLILDFLRWLEPGPRPYEEAMEAWRSSCPRLTVWEDAVDAGYIVRERRDGKAVVVLTKPGRIRLASL
jgi:hypothetical protein